MIDMPLGFDWYDGSEKGGRMADAPAAARPRRWRHIGAGGCW